MAAFDNRKIMEQNPAGPFIPIGYSFGEYIALEMARQLKAMGKEVKLLGMIYTNAYSKTDQLFDQTSTNRL